MRKMAFNIMSFIIILILTGCGETKKTEVPENMVLITGGKFMMGDVLKDPNSVMEEAHNVILNYDYYLGIYEVTFSEYDVFCQSEGKTLPDDSGFGRGNQPVINVSWYDAVKYCNYLSAQEGLSPAYNESYELINPKGETTSDITKVEGYRLPTEAEWEFAARQGGDNIRFGNGRDIADPSEINFDPSYQYDYSVAGENRAISVPVGSFPPNALGLYDMSGNVSEWCADLYDTAYYQSGQINPVNDSGTSFNRMIRGGSYNSYAKGLRTSSRTSFPMSFSSKNVGFRIARTAD